ncbi:MAG: amidohydrolase family protein, partial [Lachnospiraceae bacterium]|nr:amidohydrolase family protein [Lachnospiraceae bacterium]
MAVQTRLDEFLPDSSSVYIFPGFCDVHVHFREPGFSYKETIKTGSLAAAHGGYTAVCTMPNLNPVPDSIPHLKEQLDIIEKDAVIHVFPYGAITVSELGKELSNLEGMAPSVIAFSDDGKGVQEEEMMRQAMLRAKALGKIIAAHCEVNELLHGGYIHDGSYAALHDHKGICSESEWRQIERDVRLSKETGCSYHVCHISCKESVEIIRK